MRRVLILAVLAAIVAVAIPARAETFSRTIMVPVYGSPAIQRNLYALTGESTNGIFGYAFQLSKTFPNYFTLAPSPGGLGVEEYDIYFYSDLNNSNPTGSFFECDSGQVYCSKHGQIPPGSKWAVVTMSVGLAGSFRYSA